MASIDLKDAYCSVSIHSDFQRYVTFSWRGQLYKFVCFPNGLAPCPRQFTKLLKAVSSSLRKLGHISVVYIDDTWLTSEDYNSCVNNIAETITLLDRLGFVIHPDKSILIPTQEITFLGFIFNSAAALAANAFHISWKEYTFYAFPPFCIIQRVQHKINIDQATGIIIVPNWPTQTWWPYLMSMLINYPLILPRKIRTLFLQAQQQEIHPLHKKLELLACHLSGTSCLTKEF